MNIWNKMKQMILINPMVKKDTKVMARSMKIAWGMFLYQGLLALIFIGTLAIIKAENQYSFSNPYKDLVALFPVLAITQIGIVTMVIPIFTASAISGEKERQTFDIMMTTCMTPFSIVVGKVLSSVIQVMLFVVASVPIMALSFVLGGLSWWTLLLFIIAIFVYSVLVGSIGIFCSSICKKSIVSIILSYVVYGALCYMTVIPMTIAMFTTIGHKMGDTALFFLLNPVVFFEEFFMLAMTGESLFASNNFGNVGPVTRLLCHGALWAIVSGILLLLLSGFFMFLTSKKIDPLALRFFYKKKNVKSKSGE